MNESIANGIEHTVSPFLFSLSPSFYHLIIAMQEHILKLAIKYEKTVYRGTPIVPRRKKNFIHQYCSDIMALFMNYAIFEYRFQ